MRGQVRAAGADQRAQAEHVAPAVRREQVGGLPVELPRAVERPLPEPWPLSWDGNSCTLVNDGSENSAGP
ncbi:hypothetical protein LVX13_01180 [Streptomyces albulus]|uniref:hypothetical protein n=1 Tax=Streptomyces noursei TaxID=1971 RepID=UPI001F1A8852|nr:hypothetical protein [Streptomyces noursei]MCE4941752.1 hypothetical protein [Streptomyces noursei]